MTIINRTGSLLLEALLATVILSVSITLIIQSMQFSARASVYSRHYTEAVFLLNNKMNELLQKRVIDNGLLREEYFPKPFDQYRYTLKTHQADAEEMGNVNEVELSVSWKSGKKKNRIVLDTYLMGISP